MRMLRLTLWTLLAVLTANVGSAQPPGHLKIPPVVDYPPSRSVHATYKFDCGGRQVRLAVEPSRPQNFVTSYVPGKNLSSLEILGWPSMACDASGHEAITFHGFIRSADGALRSDNVGVLWSDGRVDRASLSP
jgi:hypothetical protein